MDAPLFQTVFFFSKQKGKMKETQASLTTV